MWEKNEILMMNVKDAVIAVKVTFLTKNNIRIYFVLFNNYSVYYSLVMFYWIFSCLFKVSKVESLKTKIDN